MLIISILSADLYLLQKLEETVNGRAIFLIVVADSWASLYLLYDRRNLLASDIS